MRGRKASERERARTFGGSAAVVVAIVAGGGCAHRSDREPVPVASLASSQAAEEAFRPLRQRWVGSDRASRAALEPNLVWFLGHYPGDDLAEVATVYLA
jgi:hypothetical protein